MMSTSNDTTPLVTASEPSDVADDQITFILNAHALLFLHVCGLLGLMVPGLLIEQINSVLRHHACLTVLAFSVGVVMVMMICFRVEIREWSLASTIAALIGWTIVLGGLLASLSAYCETYIIMIAMVVSAVVVGGNLVCGCLFDFVRRYVWPLYVINVCLVGLIYGGLVLNACMHGQCQTDPLYYACSCGIALVYTFCALVYLHVMTMSTYWDLLKNKKVFAILHMYVFPLTPCGVSGL
jgi:hypothetical protein